MSSLNCSLLIHTFNGYQHLWPGCLQSWAKIALPTLPKYVGTDTRDHLPHEFNDFQPLYSDVGEWSDRLARLLQQIPTEYVLYAQEDHWPTKTPPDLAELMQIVTQNDILRLQISSINDYYTLQRRGNLHFFKQKSKYLVSHQPSIWRKSFLLECLHPGETPWVNEYEGTKRLNKDPKITGKIAIYPLDWYAHKCVKGKVQS